MQRTCGNLNTQTYIHINTDNTYIHRESINIQVPSTKTKKRMSTECNHETSMVLDIWKSKTERGKQTNTGKFTQSKQRRNISSTGKNIITLEILSHIGHRKNEGSKQGKRVRALIQSKAIT